jgi:DNA modification methylase
MSEFNLHGFDLFGEPIKPKNQGPVAEKFTFPPFSILDARQGEWQERKRQWSSIGIKSEIGRDASVIHCPTSNNDEGLTDANYTSIFDPVLCELAYRWFSPKGGQIVDPFAGGSVRGIVCGALDRNYWGCDLRQEQIDANYEQKQELFPNAGIEWVCGDSNVTLGSAPDADLIFSCPPYGDLEVYSDHPADISNMGYDEFLVAYRSIINQSVKKLKNDRFACFVVGDFRDKHGFYRNFVSETIQAFEDAGARLYNEAILVTSVGSASMRVTKQFISGRKFAKTHQNVLVFCKGDWKTASTVCEHGLI